MNNRKVIYFIFGIVVVALIANFIYTSYILNQSSYKVLNVSQKTFKDLFIREAEDILEFSYAIGNEDEQIYFYSLDGIYNIAIYEIDGFANLNLSEINLLVNDDFDNIIFNPQRLTELKNYNIISKSTTLEGSEINFYTNSDIEILRHFETMNYAYLNIISSGVLFGNLKEYLIKIEGKEKMTFNIALIKNERSCLLIILTSNINLIFKEDILLDILKNN